MGTNVTKLKGKGAPPKMDDSPDPIQTNPRPEVGPTKPLQVRLPDDVFEDFSRTAGERFGFSKGAKKQLFLEMWEVYKSNKS